MSLPFNRRRNQLELDPVQGIMDRKLRMMKHVQSKLPELISESTMKRSRKGGLQLKTHELNVSSSTNIMENFQF